MLPDFLVQQKDGSWLIVEVKGDNMIEVSVVQVKAEYARQLASAGNITYKIIKGTDAEKGKSSQLFKSN